MCPQRRRRGHDYIDSVNNGLIWTLTKNVQSLWDQLVGEDLSGIVFVRDYLQLQFNPPPRINVYSSHVVVSTL